MKPSKIAKLVLPQGTYKVATETLAAYIGVAREPFNKADFSKSKQTAIRVEFEGVIEKALAEGSLEAKNMEFDGDPQMRSVIIVDELSAFLSKYDIDVNVEDSPIETGRYKLEDAALAIAIATGENNNHIEKKLVAAVSSRELLVYRPGSNADYEPTLISVFYEEVIWDDLNIWLENSLPRIDWRFPKPPPKPTPQKETVSERNRRITAAALEIAKELQRKNKPVRKDTICYAIDQSGDFADIDFGTIKRVFSLKNVKIRLNADKSPEKN